MKDGIKELEPGFITIDRASGPPVRLPLKDYLRAADIPVGLTHAQVAGVTYLANLVVVLIRTLIARDLLDETFADKLGMDWDLEHIIYALESLGGTYHEPQFDNVEGA